MDAAVYLNVCVSKSLIVKLSGVNVPLAAEGVIVTGEDGGPSSWTVKLAEAVPGLPLDGLGGVKV
jgi:hypothetical protein